jgi:hypothetical protein
MHEMRKETGILPTAGCIYKHRCIAKLVPLGFANCLWTHISRTKLSVRKFANAYFVTPLRRVAFVSQTSLGRSLVALPDGSDLA